MDIQIQNGTIFTKTIRPDGTVHRSSYAPGSDLSAAPQEVIDAAATAWTQDVRDAHFTERWLVNGAGELVTTVYRHVPVGHLEAGHIGSASQRTHRWNGSTIVAKSAAELAAYDAAQPLWIDGREVMRRLASSTHLGLERLSQTDAAVCKLWNTLKAGGNVNVHSAEFTEGAAYLRTIGIPSVWPDVAAFDAERLAQDTA